MSGKSLSCSRRRFLTLAGGFGTSLLLGNRPAFAVPGPAPAPAVGVIPATGESLPAIGLGTYITFNVGSSSRLRDDRAAVLQAFLSRGGGMIDSSPMYGTSEEVIGDLLARLPRPHPVFAATKIWTLSDAEGREQHENSERLWQRTQFDLQQVHNLVNWRNHLAYLRELKAQGRIRYLGVTTSHGRRHDELEDILRRETLDFVQLTYNAADRAAEKRLLPLARDRGVAVIANRPYQGGRLIDRCQRDPVPPWIIEAGITTWADFLLKFIISHPGITCAIPATSQVVHLRENMDALHGDLPDATLRRRMAAHIAQL